MYRPEHFKSSRALSARDRQRAAASAKQISSFEAGSRLHESFRQLSEAFDFGDFVEKPRFAAIHFEDDRLAGVFEAVVLLPVAEAIEVAAPVEAVEKRSLLVEVEIHCGCDTATDTQAMECFAFIGEVGDDLKLRLFIDQQVERPRTHVVLGRFDTAFLFVDPPFVRLGED